MHKKSARSAPFFAKVNAWSRLLFNPLRPHPCSPRRQQRGGVYLRDHSGWCGTRRHHSLQPGQPQPVRLRPREAGLPWLPRGRVEVGRLLSRRQVRRGVLPALRGRPGDQEKRPTSHEPAQQWGWAKGAEIFHRGPSFKMPWAFFVLYLLTNGFPKLEFGKVLV